MFMVISAKENKKLLAGELTFHVTKLMFLIS